MISVVGKRCRGTLPSRQKKKSRTDTRRASFSLISLYICALWSDHTLNIYLDVVVDWLVPRTQPTHHPPTRFDGSSPTGTCQRKRKENHEWFFSFFSVSVSWLFMCSFARPLPLSVSPLRVSIPLLILQGKRISGKMFISFRCPLPLLFLYNRIISKHVNLSMSFETLINSRKVGLKKRWNFAGVQNTCFGWGFTLTKIWLIYLRPMNI